MVFAKFFQKHSVSTSLRNCKSLRNKAKVTFFSDLIRKSWKNTLSLKDFRIHSMEILKMWIHQCEYVLAYRVRRGQQMFSLYSRLWSEKILVEFLRRFRLQLVKGGAEIMLGIVGVSMYDWNSNRIPDDEMRRHLNAFEYAYKLRDKTITCAECNGKTTGNGKSHITVCYCAGGVRKTYDQWTVFIEKKDMVIWRRPHVSGSFEYKVYGSYDDVSGEDFLNVQIDTRYRKEWDNTAIILDLIESDPQLETNSDIIYWEMQWPKFFANRDYVFNRRFIVDCNSKTIVIISQTTTHPACPIQPNKYRVTDYFSAMVVKPHTELDKPGIEFVLTYFDNPGVNIPNSVTSWVAMRAMPDFLGRLREATKYYKGFCERTENDCICILTDRSGIVTSKGRCQKPKQIDNKHDEGSKESVFGMNTKDIEKKIGSIKENVENRFDEIKGDIKKAMTKFKKELQKGDEKESEEASGDYFNINDKPDKENDDVELQNHDLNFQKLNSNEKSSSDRNANLKETDNNSRVDKRHEVAKELQNSKNNSKNKEEVSDVLLSPSPIIQNNNNNNSNDRKSFWKYFYPNYYYR